MYDLNDARVETLRMVTEAGMSTADFNRMWTLIVSNARKGWVPVTSNS